MKKEIIINKKGYKSKKDLIDYMKQTKSEIESLIKILKSPGKAIENKIIIQYILTQSIIKTCDKINKEGHKTDNGNKYSPSDVSELIKKGNDKVNPTLLELSRHILDKNWKGVSRRYN